MKKYNTKSTKVTNFIKDYYRVVKPQHSNSQLNVEWTKSGDYFKKLSFYDETTFVNQSSDTNIITIPTL